MSETTNLKLFKHDEPLSTNQNQFDIDKALHQNWDKIDEYVGTNIQNIQTLQEENAELKKESTLLKSQIPNGQAVGENITLTDSSNLPYEKFNIGGNSVQDGTPIPEAPVEIKSVGDDGTVGIKQRGKNLLKGLSTPVDDSSYWSDVNKNYFTPLEDGWGRFSCDNTSGTSTVFVNAKVRLGTVGLKPNTQYTLITEIRNSSMSENSDAFFQIVTNNKLASFKSAIALEYSNINVGGTFKKLSTTKEDLSNKLHDVDTYLRLGAGTKGTVEARISLIEGDIDIDTFNYEAYIGNDYTLQISEPLRSLPNEVRDTIEGGKIHRRVGVVVLDGSETEIGLNVRTNGYQFDFKNVSASNGDSENITMLSSHFTGIKFNDRNNYNEAIYSYSGDNRIRIITNKATTIEEFKTWLSANPVTVQYELAEEIIEPHTENPLQNATTYKNITNIFSTDEVSPVFYITYKKDLETLFNNLNSALMQEGTS